LQEKAADPQGSAAFLFLAVRIPCADSDTRNFKEVS
jgi:hypothetical protein